MNTLFDHRFNPLPETLEELLKKKRKLEEELVPAQDELDRKEVAFKAARTKRDNAASRVDAIKYDLNMIAVAMNLQLTVTPEFASSIGLETKEVRIVREAGEDRHAL